MSKEKKSLSDQVVEYILVRSDDELADLTVKMIAQEFSVNPSYLSRRFQDQTKFSLGYYLIRIRVFRAASILRENPGITVKEVGRKLGFCTTGYFIQVFRKFFGTSPGRYKEFMKKAPPLY